jgi:hypothetical protein
MPRMNEAFPSRYLKADDDVPEVGIDLTIKDAELERIGDEMKLVVYFRGQDKGLVCNKTNAKVIEALAKSDDTDDWVGMAITLYATDVQFKDDMVRGIRVRTRTPVPKPPRPSAVTDNPEAIPEAEGQAPASGSPF